MTLRLSHVLTLVLGLVLGASAVWLAGDEEQAAGPEPVSGFRGAEPAPSPSDREAGGPRVPPADALPPEAQRYPEHFRDLQGRPEEEPETVSPTVAYPKLEKLAVEPLSQVPHRVLGAWDEAHDSPAVGDRRAFVLVVEPGTSDAELERLARDVRDRHRDAAILNVRIYDSEAAAIQPKALDGGERAFRHLVAQVNKNQGVPVDVIRVRGKVIGP